MDGFSGNEDFFLGNEWGVFFWKRNYHNFVRNKIILWINYGYYDNSFPRKNIIIHIREQNYSYYSHSFLNK